MPLIVHLKTGTPACKQIIPARMFAFTKYRTCTVHWCIFKLQNTTETMYSSYRSSEDGEVVIAEYVASGGLELMSWYILQM